MRTVLVALVALVLGLMGGWVAQDYATMRQRETLMWQYLNGPTAHALADGRRLTRAEVLDALIASAQVKE